MKKALILVLILVNLPGGLFAESRLVEKVAGGTVDLQKGVITVTGEGKAPPGLKNQKAREAARKAALEDAQQKIRQVIANLRLESDAVVKDYPELENDISQALLAVTVAEIKYANGAQASIKVNLPLFGYKSLAKVIYEGILPLTGARREREEAVEPGVPVYTGLIVDASTVGVMPAMSPKIVTAKGDEVYGTMDIDPDYVVQVGIVGYANSVEEAKKDIERVGSRPLVVKAVDIWGPLKADAVVAEDDAKLIRGANRQVDFLSKCRVVLVLS